MSSVMLEPQAVYLGYMTTTRSIVYTIWFMLLLSYIWKFYVFIDRISLENKTYKVEQSLVAIQKENRELEYIVASGSSLLYIREQALKQGFQEPTNLQIIYTK